MRWKSAVVHTPKTFRHNLHEFCSQNKTDFLVYSNANREHLSTLENFRGFHVIRDPRDIVVSSYFSHLYSHPTAGWDYLVKHRQELQSLTKDEGLLLEILECRRKQFEEMYKWDYDLPNIRELKMEDFVQHPYKTFLELFEFLGIVENTAKISNRFFFFVLGTSNRIIWKTQMLLTEHLSSRMPKKLIGIRLNKITAERLLGVVYENDFSRRSGGRITGQEDIKHHYRKGISGDWRNHFKKEHVKAFKDNYNDLLIKLGYESDYDW
jgi:hypothetical protein